MQVPEAFSPAERLHAAIRERAPQFALSIVRDGETGLSHVHVTCGYAGPWTATWNGANYQLRDRETDPWTQLPADPDEAADAIVDALRSIDAGQRH
ncbi:hypothetical protein GCM10022254_72750 [Actinomadura meridiana]|uniref:Uncharacterized protein n=1 Tax=Actinomadura meridiana TaxID=559626 RepID=A0ABP8CPR0_9ACTN